MQRANVAIIGTRGHYAQVLDELTQMPDASLVAFAHGGRGDTAEPVATWAAARGHVARDFADRWQDLIEEANANVLVVCGPLELHADMSIAAIERGIHVLVEKPAAMTFSELNLLRRAMARHPDVHVATMMFSRYAPGFYTASRLIQSGAIGEPRLIEARKSYKLGRRSEYYHRRDSYGGTILWVGSHAIDWVGWLSGSPFRSVYANHSSAHNDAHGSLERSAMCQFVLNSGCFASVAIDFFRPGRANTHGDDWARVVGTTGVVEVRPNEVWLVNGDQDGAVVASLQSPERAPLRDFIDHVRGNCVALNEREGTLMLADACLRSRLAADESRVVNFTEPLDDARVHLGHAAKARRCVEDIAVAAGQ